MKKGLLALTMLIVFAASVYAYAPVLSNIPDIIIGDLEDGDANNFFRFSDAFMFDSKVSDQDDADADLLWSWVKVSGDGDITINGLGEETVSTINPANELRAAGLGASFRDIIASPLSQDPGPYSGSPLANLYIAIHVSDGVAEDSQEVRVTSVDGVEDGQSVSQGEKILDVDFATNATNANGGDNWEQWTVSSELTNTTYGEYDSTGQRLVITCPGTSAWPSYTQWLHINATTGVGLEPDVDWTAGQLIAAKINVSASKDDLNPSIRFRIADLDPAARWTGMMTIASHSGGGANGPTTTPQDFYYVCKPVGAATGTAYIAFDCWSPSSGDQVYIEGFKIYNIDEPALTAEATINDFAAASFGVAGAAGDLSKVTIAEHISIVDVTAWASAANFVNLTNTLTKDALVKATYSVSATGTANCNGVRMRLNDPANDGYTSMFRVDEDGSVIDINGTAQDFASYHVVGNTITQIAVWTDSIARSDAASGVTVFESVVIESGVLPELPD